MSIIESLPLFFTGIAAGLLGAMLGLGGGIFIVPILSLGFGYPLTTAVGTSIVAVIATSSSAAANYVKARLTNIRLGMLLETATTVGAVGGGLLAVALNEQALAGIFGLVLLYTSFTMFRTGRSGEEPKPDNGDALIAKSGSLGWASLAATYHDAALRRDVQYQPQRVPFGIGASIVAGVVSGLLGIGGGPIKVPVMHLLMKVPIKAAIGTSNFMVGVTAAASAFIYYGRDAITPAIVVPIVLGIVIGAQIGSRVSQRIHSHLLARAFAVILLYVAAQMILKATGVRIGL